MTEACAGISRSFESISWCVVPDVAAVPYGKQQVQGYWSAAGNRIVLAGDVHLDGGIVRHEMLHAILRKPGHSREAFLHRCGGVVDCGDECIADAGPPPPARTDTPIVPVSALEISATITPSVPASALDDGHFSFIVTARNPALHAVMVELPAPPGNGPAMSFAYQVWGPAGGLAGGVRALDPSVMMFQAGESKRQVFDFRVGRDSGGGAFSPGTYTFRGSFGDQWVTLSSVLLGP